MAGSTLSRFLIMLDRQILTAISLIQVFSAVQPLEEVRRILQRLVGLMQMSG